AFAKIGVDLPLHEKLEDLAVADKQIVAIARAILYDAKLLIMDEPTTTLTRKEIDKLFEIVKKLQAQGVSVLFVSHKLDEVFEIATRFTVMRNGKHVITDITSNADHEKMVYYISGRKLDGDKFSCKSAPEDKPIFEVSKLSLKNGFSDISFKVMPGEILGITGLLGSGRTELAMSLFGLYPADEGDIKIKGKTVSIRSPQDALKHKIAYVPEDRLTEGLFLLQSIKDNIAIANIDHMLKKNGSVNEELVNKDSDQWKNDLSIKMGDIDEPIGTLSGGNQQKVVLAKWLETKPDVLILNGPTVGVDIGAKYDLHAHIREIVKDKTTAVIIISDDILEVIQNCNRILVVKKGRITDELTNVDLDETKLLSIVTSQN
ncbi:MAG: sugar ABC transporter ATP-binding protein, partial [Oscillospiraceae bacterium]